MAEAQQQSQANVRRNKLFSKLDSITEKARAVKRNGIEFTADHLRKSHQTKSLGKGVFALGVGASLLTDIPIVGEALMIGGGVTWLAGIAGQYAGEKSQVKRTKDGERICAHSRRISDCEICSPKKKK